MDMLRKDRIEIVEDDLFGTQRMIEEGVADLLLNGKRQRPLPEMVADAPIAEPAGSQPVVPRPPTEIEQRSPIAIIPSK